MVFKAPYVLNKTFIKLHKIYRNFNSLFFYFFLIICFLFICFNKSVLFLNEEFLVGFCVLIFLFIVFYFSKRMLNFLFFFKAELIYLSLVYLSKLVLYLTEKLIFLFNTNFLHNIYFCRFQMHSLFSLINESLNNFSCKIVLNFVFTHFFLTYFFYISFSNFYILENYLINFFDCFSDETSQEEEDDSIYNYFFVKFVYYNKQIIT